jgi:hypothetical protein
MIAEPRPQGFYKAVTLSGKTVLAFNCLVCHHEYLDCPPEIPHCGRVEKLEKHWWERLPKVQLTRPRAIFLD